MDMGHEFYAGSGPRAVSNNPIATCVELYDKNITIVEYKGRSSQGQLAELGVDDMGGMSRSYMFD